MIAGHDVRHGVWRDQEAGSGLRNNNACRTRSAVKIAAGDVLYQSVGMEWVLG